VKILFRMSFNEDLGMKISKASEPLISSLQLEKFDLIALWKELGRRYLLYLLIIIIDYIGCSEMLSFCVMKRSSC
jgi:hypothetical protein